MSLSHLIILGLIALIAIPPEKLPEMARQLAKFIYDIKRTADSVLNEIKQEALFKPEDIIDQNIKTKLQEIHSSLNQNVQNINSSIQNSATPSTTVTELPAVNPTKPTDDGTNKS